MQIVAMMIGDDDDVGTMMGIRLTLLMTASTTMTVMMMLMTIMGIALTLLMTIIGIVMTVMMTLEPRIMFGTIWWRELAG